MIGGAGVKRIRMTLIINPVIDIDASGKLYLHDIGGIAGGVAALAVVPCPHLKGSSLCEVRRLTKGQGRR